jgi:hypothetical protein
MSISRSQTRLVAVLALLLFVGGCVVGDQLTTFTIRPDGSADLVIFRSNLHSTQEGEKGKTELAEYKAQFDTRTDDELARVTLAGGTIVDASWIREQVPLSNLLHARFPNAAALAKYLTIHGEDGSLEVKTEFRAEGARRSLAVTVTVPVDKNHPPEALAVDVEKLRQACANGISETRIALDGGKITTARGFTVAEDKQSALLDPRTLDEILRTGGKGELLLEWEVSP